MDTIKKVESLPIDITKGSVAFKKATEMGMKSNANQASFYAIPISTQNKNISSIYNVERSFLG